MKKRNTYIFAASNLRAKERGYSAAERLRQMYGISSVESLCRFAAEIWNIDKADSPEVLTDRAMSYAVSDVKACVPNMAPFYPLLYKYDCTNIKTVLKANILSVPPENMLFECGSINKRVLLESLCKNELDILPENMRKSAMRAPALYKETGDASVIDTLLDQACFEDMKADAEKGGLHLVKRIVTLRSDAVNLLAYLRLYQTQNVAVFMRNFIKTGEIPASAFVEKGAFLSPDKAALPLASHEMRDVLTSHINDKSIFSITERKLDEIVLILLRDCKYIAYGPETAVRYLLVREAEITNFRIFRACLEGMIRKDSLRERIRSAYV